MSLANVYFYLHQDTGYFAAASSDIPLLHLWSLGVEEQFYIIWPVLLILVYRLPRAKLLFFAGAALTAVASFVLGQVIFKRDPSFAYYMLPTRAGELLLGALVAVAVLRQIGQRIPHALVAPVAMTGFALMFASLFLISDKQVFPGMLAVPPTLGTALLILAGHCSATRISRFLALRPLVWVGLISYSAYLWHWPLLAFFQYAIPEVRVIPGVTIFGLTLLLSWLTYRYVERPARRSTAPPVKVFLRQYILPAGSLALIALTSMKLDGYGLRWFSEDYKRQLVAIRQTTRPPYAYDYVCQKQRISMQDARNERCVVGPETSQAPRAILWGDSNAAHYVGMIGAFAKTRGFRFRNLAVGGCPPILGDPAGFVRATRLADCRASQDVSRQALTGVEVVMISALWTDYPEKFLDTFFDTVRALRNEGKLVILIGKAPVIPNYDPRCPQKALSYPFLKCPLSTAKPQKDVSRINARLKAFADRTANVEYFDVTKYLCPRGICSAFDADGHPLYYDQEHLTTPASWQLGNLILRQDGVPPPFDLIPSAAPPAAAKSN
jgi:hypothetical protein